MSDFILFPRGTDLYDGVSRDDRERLNRSTGRTRGTGGDREDTLEELARLLAAEKTVPAGRLWMSEQRTLLSGPVGAVNWSTGERVDAGTAAQFLAIGPVPNLHNDGVYQQDPRHRVDQGADRYFDSPVFLKHAGRRVVRATVGEGLGGFPQLMDVVHDLPSECVFLKGSRPKWFTGLLDKGDDPECQIYEQVPMDAFDASGAVVAQEYVDMSWEYRVFVWAPHRHGRRQR